MNVRALVAEAVGTFVLVGMGSLGISSALIVTGGNDPSVILQLFVPFAFGLGLMAAIAIGGHASGGHFNPAVTLAALLDGRVDLASAIGYAVAQLIGALAASLMILLVLSKEVVTATINRAGPTAQDVLQAQVHAFAVEIILTAIFVAVILTVTRKLPELAIIVIPLVLAAIHFAAIPISGASVNPVRSLAPAIVAGDYAGLWVYLAGPLIGAVLGWGLYRFLTPPDDEVSVEIEEEFLDDEFDDDALEVMQDEGGSRI
jgi:MIP family channel proteins